MIQALLEVQGASPARPAALQGLGCVQGSGFGLLRAETHRASAVPADFFHGSCVLHHGCFGQTGLCGGEEGKGASQAEAAASMPSLGRAGAAPLNMA